MVSKGNKTGEEMGNGGGGGYSSKAMVRKKSSCLYYFLFLKFSNRPINTANAMLYHPALILEVVKEIIYSKL